MPVIPPSSSSNAGRIGGTKVKRETPTDNHVLTYDAGTSQWNGEAAAGGSSDTNLSENAIINGNFIINQRVYVSSAALASGAYGHDRWKAGAGGGDYTFTQLASSTQITIEAGKTLIQVIEDKNVIGGTYTLSWTGTAQARYAVDSATPAGSYADSPIAITGQTAGTVMSVEFDDGTLGEVVLNSGTVALPFMPKSYAQELLTCKRYYYRLTATVAYGKFAMGQVYNTSSAQINFHHPVTMRTSPTLSTGGNLGLTDTDTTGRAVTGNSSDAISPDHTTHNFSEAGTNLTAGDVTQLRGENDVTAYIAFSAEL